MKKLKRLSLAMLFMILFMLITPSSCVLCTDPPLFFFDFVNKSSQPVTILGYFGVESTDLLQPSFFRYWEDDFEVVQSGDSIKLDSFYEGQNEDKTHQLLIIKQSTIDKYGRDSIIKNDIYDKRYVITYPEVTAGLKIIYTGD